MNNTERYNQEMDSRNRHYSALSFLNDKENTNWWINHYRNMLTSKRAELNEGQEETIRNIIEQYEISLLAEDLKEALEIEDNLTSLKKELRTIN